MKKIILLLFVIAFCAACQDDQIRLKVETARVTAEKEWQLIRDMNGQTWAPIKYDEALEMVQLADAYVIKGNYVLADNTYKRFFETVEDIKDITSKKNDFYKKAIDQQQLIALDQRKRELQRALNAKKMQGNKKSLNTKSKQKKNSFWGFPKKKSEVKVDTAEKPTLLINLPDTVFIERSSTNIGFKGFAINTESLIINGENVEIDSVTDKFYIMVKLEMVSTSKINCVATHKNGQSVTKIIKLVRRK